MLFRVLHNQATTTTIKMQNSDITQKSYLCLFVDNPSPSLQSLAKTDLFSVLSCVFSRLSYKWFIQYVAFESSLLTFNIMGLRFMHVIVYVSSSFLFITK